MFGQSSSKKQRQIFPVFREEKKNERLHMTIMWQLCHHEWLLSLRDYLMSHWLCFCLYLNFMSFSSSPGKGHWLFALPKWHTSTYMKRSKGPFILLGPLECIILKWRGCYLLVISKLKVMIFFSHATLSSYYFYLNSFKCHKNITFAIFRMLIFSLFSFCISIFII